MDTRISKPLVWINIAGLLAAMTAMIAVYSTQLQATEAGKKKSSRSTGAIQSKPAVSGDSFQLSLSNIPYSSDPESDYVRIYCAPGSKHNSKKQNK